MNSQQIAKTKRTTVFSTRWRNAIVNQSGLDTRALILRTDAMPVSCLHEMQTGKLNLRKMRISPLLHLHLPWSNTNRKTVVGSCHEPLFLQLKSMKPTVLDPPVGLGVPAGALMERDQRILVQAVGKTSCWDMSLIAVSPQLVSSSAAFSRPLGIDEEPDPRKCW